MANQIESIVGQVNTNFVGQSSRYLNSELINYEIGTTKFVTFKTFKRPTRQSNPGDRFYMITKGAEYRPDIIAKRYYNNEGYWWLLLLANNMMDITEFKAGVTIVLPTPYL